MNSRVTYSYYNANLIIVTIAHYPYFGCPERTTFSVRHKSSQTFQTKNKEQTKKGWSKM